MESGYTLPRGNEPHLQHGSNLLFWGAVTGYLCSIPALMLWADARHQSLVTEKNIEEDETFEDIMMALN